MQGTNILTLCLISIIKRFQILTQQIIGVVMSEDTEQEAKVRRPDDLFDLEGAFRYHPMLWALDFELHPNHELKQSINATFMLWVECW